LTPMCRIHSSSPDSDCIGVVSGTCYTAKTRDRVVPNSCFSAKATPVDPKCVSYSLCSVDFAAGVTPRCQGTRHHVKKKGRTSPSSWVHTRGIHTRGRQSIGRVNKMLTAPFSGDPFLFLTFGLLGPIFLWAGWVGCMRAKRNILALRA